MGYSLVITEKPDAARRLATALAEGNVEVRTKRGASYYLIERRGKQHVIVPAVGHLFTLKQRGKGWTYPVFDVTWLESYKANRRSLFSKKYLLNIKELAEDALEHIIATDYDTEGRIIAYNILRFICNTDRAKTMRFSTLTASDLREAYENAADELEWGMINAGIARHFLDYFYGVNITRALTLALNKNAKLGFQILSAGRVQAPTLNMLLRREQRIRQFQPTPYWQIELHAEQRGTNVVALHTNDKFWEKRDADAVLVRCQGKTPRVVKVLRRQYRQTPPPPFNLTDLQTEAYRFFGYTPLRTLNVAQTLYTQGWISYPRTSSQQLPEIIGYRRILTALSRLRKYEALATELLTRTRLRPSEGRKRDPAHVAIYPTHEPPQKRLTGPQGRVYDLICRRFLATFAEAAVRETMKVTIQMGMDAFRTEGSRTLERNWHRFYQPYIRFKETLLPTMEEGDELVFHELRLIDKETQPPARYTQASLIKTLEDKGLGTRATRAQIVKTIFDRKYATEGSVRITQLGETVVEILREYCPKIVSEKLTREFEAKMEQVYDGKIDKDDVIQDARHLLTDILDRFKKKEDEIGKKLVEAFRRAQNADTYVGVCPECGNDLRVIYSKKTHLRFVGCDGYFKGLCTFSSPLPQRARIQPVTTTCKHCDYPMVMVFSKGKRRPWFLCLNVKCPNKQATKKRVS